ncbi:MAG: urea carboxylase-associated family protein [Intrasporangiaceae bacterium]|nr:urea carboxylase-associated family protein [Intrasporangiaceae bacterium]
MHDLSPARRYDGDGDAPAPGWTRIPPQSGLLVELAPGQALEVVDPLGEQVSDLYLVSSEDVEECFSAGRTVDYNNTLYVSVGGRLWSNRSRVMATIVADTVGVHDMTLTPCSQDTFDILYPEFEGAEHPSCFANLCAALEPVGVSRDRIGTTLNVFMDVWTDRAGELHIDPPPTTPGDRFAIRAEIPLFVGVTACSAEKSNNGHCTPIDVRVTT